MGRLSMTSSSHRPGTYKIKAPVIAYGTDPLYVSVRSQCPGADLPDQQEEKHMTLSDTIRSMKARSPGR